MKILKIVVDELPSSCYDCVCCQIQFNNTGWCLNLDNTQVSTIANCRHKDCPLVVESEE